jgi:hypothetical protein
MSIFSALGAGFGLTSARNNSAAAAATNNANASNDQLYGDYQSANNQNTALSTQLANANYMQGAQNVYNQQQNAAQMLYNQAAGNAPSASQLQMQAGLANANNQAQSVALANQGGMNPGATQRNLLSAQAQQDASIVSQGMATRAAEQAQQQQAYNGILSTMQNQQQNMGGFAYQQGQNNLNYQAQAAQNAYQLGFNRNQANLNNAVGNINQAGQAVAAQGAALNKTLESAAGRLL